MCIIMENILEIKPVFILLVLLVVEVTRGEAFGEFDHATWVTMTDKGPRIANLLVDGIMKDDVTQESHQIFWRSLVFEEYFKKGSELEGKELTLILRNPFEFPVKGRFEWIQSVNKTFDVEPKNSNIFLLPMKKGH